MKRLSQNEHNIMDVLWRTPGLTRAEITIAAKQMGTQTWSDRSCQEMLCRLAEKGLIKPVGTKTTNRKMARRWVPTVPKDEYYADMLAVEMTADERARLIHRLELLADAAEVMKP